MINKNDFKYIIKKIIIGLVIAFILFNINKCNASALVYKNSEWYGVDTSIQTGTLSGNSNGTNIIVSLEHNVENYDYIAYPLPRYNFSSVPITSYSYVNYCTKYGQWQELYPTQHTVYSCESTSSNTINNSVYVPASYTISFVITTTSGAGSGCFLSSDYEGYVICPTNRLSGYAKQMEINISFNGPSGNTLYYYFSFGGTVNYLNNDSTEIVNGLGGIQNQQQQTNNTLTDNNISGANTDTNNALSSINSSVNSTINNTIDASSLNTLLTGFVNQLSNSTCTPITLPIPFTNENIVLPCLGTEFSQRIPVLWSLYELIITGVIVLRFWQHAVEFILNVLDPYHIGANNIPNGGGK